MELTTALTIVVSLISAVRATPVSQFEYCSVSYQQSLKEVLRLRRTCATAMYDDCCQITQVSKTFNGQNISSGVYYVRDMCSQSSAFGVSISPMQARCDMESNDGGWTVLVRRTPDVDQRELFDRTWEEYENGFGNLTGEFWYGLRNMHCLTSQGQMEVEVEMRRTDGAKLVLAYDNFRVDGPGTSYTLHVSDQKHEGFDHFGYHNGRIFSTRDRVASGTSCSGITTGWWFSTCYRLHLTHTTQPRLANPSISNYDYAELRVRSKSCISELTSEPSSCQ